jgi:hypothetical protein
MVPPLFQFSDHYEDQKQTAESLLQLFKKVESCGIICTTPGRGLFNAFGGNRKALEEDLEDCLAKYEKSDANSSLEIISSGGVASMIIERIGSGFLETRVYVNDVLIAEVSRDESWIENLTKEKNTGNGDADLAFKWVDDRRKPIDKQFMQKGTAIDVKRYIQDFCLDLRSIQSRIYLMNLCQIPINKAFRFSRVEDFLDFIGTDGPLSYLNYHGVLTALLKKNKNALYPLQRILSMFIYTNLESQDFIDSGQGFEIGNIEVREVSLETGKVLRVLRKKDTDLWSDLLIANMKKGVKPDTATGEAILKKVQEARQEYTRTKESYHKFVEKAIEIKKSVRALEAQIKEVTKKLQDDSEYDKDQPNVNSEVRQKTTLIKNLDADIQSLQPEFQLIADKLKEAGLKLKEQTEGCAFSPEKKQSIKNTIDANESVVIDLFSKFWGPPPPYGSHASAPEQPIDDFSKFRDPSPPYASAPEQPIKEARLKAVEGAKVTPNVTKTRRAPVASQKSIAVVPPKEDTAGSSLSQKSPDLEKQASEWSKNQEAAIKFNGALKKLGETFLKAYDTLPGDEKKFAGATKALKTLFEPPDNEAKVKFASLTKDARRDFIKERVDNIVKEYKKLLDLFQTPKSPTNKKTQTKQRVIGNIVRDTETAWDTFYSLYKNYEEPEDKASPGVLGAFNLRSFPELLKSIPSLMFDWMGSKSE